MLSGNQKNNNFNDISELINRITRDLTVTPLKPHWIAALESDPAWIYNFMFIYSVNHGKDIGVTLCSIAVYTYNLELLACLHDILRNYPTHLEKFKEITIEHARDKAFRSKDFIIRENELEAYIATHFTTNTEDQLLAMCNPATRQFIEGLKQSPKSFACRFEELNVTEDEIKQLHLAPEEYINPVTEEMINIPVLVVNQVFDWHDIVSHFKISGDRLDRTITPYRPYDSLQIKISQIQPDRRAVRDMLRMLNAVNDHRMEKVSANMRDLSDEEVGLLLEKAVMAQPIDKVTIQACIKLFGQKLAAMRIGNASFPFLYSIIQFAPLELINNVLDQFKDYINDIHIGWSLLHQACSSRREPAVISALLQAGCRHINTQGPHLSTPLICAARERLDEVIKVLLEAGADPTITDFDGHDAMYYVTQEMTVRIPTHAASATLLANAKGLSLQMISIFKPDQIAGQSISSAPACNK